jgi:hypothetical protein
MPIRQKTRACATCGAIVVLQVSQGDGEPFEGIDNEQQHAEWHAQLHQRFAALGEPQVHPRPRG